MERGIDKITKYQDLARELGRLWNVETEIVSVVIGACLGIWSIGLKFWE